MMNASTGSDFARYSRQILLSGIGVEGQERLGSARVLIVGLGGLGIPIAQYLVGAGVGTIGLLDSDFIDLTNLHRQVIYGSKSLGMPKVEVAKERLHDLNPGVSLRTHQCRLTPENATSIIEAYDIIADASDNFATRYLINDTCVKLGLPEVFGSVYGFEGQISIFDSLIGPCYCCLYPQEPGSLLFPNCEDNGVLGSVAGMLGTIQANETLKLILGIGQPLIGTLLLLDTLSMDSRRIFVRKNPDCPCCGIDGGAGRRNFVLEQSEPKESTLQNINITAEELVAMREEGKKHMLLDVREPFEFEIANIGGKLIPMGELLARLEEIPHDEPVIVLCHSGNRSLRVTAYLRSQGYENVSNLAGGIDHWSAAIDPKVPRY